METEAVEITELLPVYFGRHKPSLAGMVIFFFYIFFHQCRCCFKKTEIFCFRTDCCLVPGSGTGQNGAVQQAEWQRAHAAHGQDDGMQRSQDIALRVVRLQSLRQLRQRRHVLDSWTTSCKDGRLRSKVSVRKVMALWLELFHAAFPLADLKL